MVTISAVISAYNEEKKIEECLASVSWVDEIIFIDNSSTDSTPQIAKKFHVKLFKRPNNPMLNINKNYGMGKVTSDWILYLDADERVTPELKKEIEHLLNRHSGLSLGMNPRDESIRPPPGCCEVTPRG